MSQSPHRRRTSFYNLNPDGSLGNPYASQSPHRRRTSSHIWHRGRRPSHLTVAIASSSAHFFLRERRPPAEARRVVAIASSSAHFFLPPQNHLQRLKSGIVAIASSSAHFFLHYQSKGRTQARQHYVAIASSSAHFFLPVVDAWLQCNLGISVSQSPHRRRTSSHCSKNWT